MDAFVGWRAPVVGGAGDRPTRIRVRYLPDRLELEVRGSRAGGGAASAALMAARERVLALGGSFSADTSDGLQILHALLPAVPAHARRPTTRVAPLFRPVVRSGAGASDGHVR